MTTPTSFHTVVWRLLIPIAWIALLLGFVWAVGVMFSPMWFGWKPFAAWAVIAGLFAGQIWLFAKSGSLWSDEKPVSAIGIRFFQIATGLIPLATLFWLATTEL